MQIYANSIMYAIIIIFKFNSIISSTKRLWTLMKSPQFADSAFLLSEFELDETGLSCPFSQT